jgi:hypothetical protein
MADVHAVMTDAASASDRPFAGSGDGFTGPADAPL